jgi:glycosyltransferase involved in cell wall biosynthesis
MDQNRSEEIMDDKPLVTFALLAYNQEQFIREAIEGAFAQTYSPLEIILSDDCSLDNTFQIMKDMADAYSGPHAVRVRSCAKNRGLAEQINEVMAEVRSEFVVVAAGDDISEPARVERLVVERLKNHCKIMCIYSDVSTINVDGDTIKSCGINIDHSGDDLAHFVRQPYALGSSYAFDLVIYRDFGPFLSNLCNEDFIFPFRALLLCGAVAYVDAPLVRYRIGTGVGHKCNEIHMRPANRMLLGYKRKEALYLQLLCDLQKIQIYEQYNTILEEHLIHARQAIYLISGSASNNALLLFNALLRNPMDFRRLLRISLAKSCPMLWEALRHLKRQLQ